MSDNVIPLGRGGERNNRQVDEARAEFRRKQRESSISVRREVIQQKIERNPIMKPKTRVQIAQNMWEILERLENNTPPIKKREVLEKVVQGDSTKRLPRFALNPNRKKQTRGEPLTAKISKYVELLNAAADLSGADPDQLLEALVDGTDYAPTDTVTDSVGEEGSELEGGWGDIEIALERVAEGISRTHGLPRFFRSVEDYEIQDSGLQFASGHGLRDLYRAVRLSTFLPAIVPTDHLPPCPSVVLGWMRAFDDIPCTIKISLGDGWGDREEEFREMLEGADLEEVWLRGIAEPRTRCVLELRPFGEPMSVRPVLRFQSAFVIRTREDFDGFVLAGGDSYRRGDSLGIVWGALQAGGNAAEDTIAAACDEETDSHVTARVEALFKPQDLEVYAASDHAGAVEGHSLLVPVSRAKRHLAKPMVGETSEDKRFCYETLDIMKHRGIERPKAGPTTLGHNTMAAALERSLLEVPAEVRLDRLLDLSAQTMVRELKASLDRLQMRRQEGLARILADYEPGHR